MMKTEVKLYYVTLIKRIVVTAKAHNREAAKRQALADDEDNANQGKWVFTAAEVEELGEAQ